MLKFETTILKFAKQGEKTGWTYIFISEKNAQKLKPNTKKSFRIKGYLDDYFIEGVALIPFGNGEFILPLNMAIRKGIKKIHGATVVVKIEEDTSPIKLNTDLIDCLQDEPAALAFYNTLTMGHKNYFSKWIDSAKTEQTKAKRIATCVNALAKKWDYGLMIRTQTQERKKLME